MVRYFPCFRQQEPTGGSVSRRATGHGFYHLPPAEGAAGPARKINPPECSRGSECGFFPRVLHPFSGNYGLLISGCGTLVQAMIRSKIIKISTLLFNDKPS